MSGPCSKRQTPIEQYVYLRSTNGIYRLGIEGVQRVEGGNIKTQVDGEEVLAFAGFTSDCVRGTCVRGT